MENNVDENPSSAGLGLAANVGGLFDLARGQAYVGGRWVSAKSGKTYPVIKPEFGEVVGLCADAAGEDATEAAEAAKAAFDSNWRLTTAKERSDVLRRWFEACNQNLEQLAKILVLENGKPIKEARTELKYGFSFLGKEWHSEEARRITGETVATSTADRQIVTVLEPVGVAAVITPANFPSAAVLRKVGAALAAGCTCVVKPAAETPLSALALAAVAEPAGVPPGVFNVITTGQENTPGVGRALCESESVSAVSFTGSTAVGKVIYGQCASTVKRVCLELGGCAPFIVFDAADLATAVQGCMASKFRNTGQSCVSANRILVQSGVYDKFVALLADAVGSQLKFGDAMDETVNMGPLLNEGQLRTIEAIVEDALAKGAKILTGGESHPRGRLFYKPTILTGVTRNMEACGVVFGPVVPIMRYGLAGYLFSQDVGQCWRVSRRIEAGVVGINTGLVNCCEGAFGGVKESGLGREGGNGSGIAEFTEKKCVIFGNII